MKDLMIDLETMGTGSNAAIVQIGAVFFDRETGKTGAQFKLNVDLQTCLDAGLKVTGSTVQWWMGQDEKARAGLFENPRPVSITDALANFSEWLHVSTIGKPYASFEYSLWGRSPRFDLTILENACKAVKMGFFWDYKKEMCVRTIEVLGPELKKAIDEKNFFRNTHDVISDCLHQIEYVSAIWQRVMTPMVPVLSKPNHF